MFKKLYDRAMWIVGATYIVQENTGVVHLNNRDKWSIRILMIWQVVTQYSHCPSHCIHKKLVRLVLMWLIEALLSYVFHAIQVRTTILLSHLLNVKQFPWISSIWMAWSGNWIHILPGLKILHQIHRKKRK